MVTEILPSIYTSETEIELFSHFKRFTTYFNTYNTNKKELYKPTGIPKTIVNNIKIFIDNYNMYQGYNPYYNMHLGTKYDLNKYITQEGINLYNKEIKESYCKPMDDLFSLISSMPTNEQVRVMFDFPNFLAGWDINNERTNGGFILEQDNKYYLAVVKDKSIFKNLNEDTKGKNYNKLIYKFIPGASKYFGKNITESNSPAEIIEIKKKDNLSSFETQQLIKYIKEDFIPQYASLNNEIGEPYFNFKFKEKYESLYEFYDDIDSQSILMKYQKVSAEIIDSYVKAGKLYLFQIYNKDFGQGKGRNSLNTIYLEKLFSKENMNDPNIKLNGDAKIFYREPTVTKINKYGAGTNIKNKKPRNGKEYSKFDYDIIADNRFTKGQFTFNVSLTFNTKYPPDTLYTVFDEYIAKNYNNVLTIIRGQNNPFGFALYNNEGKLLEKSVLDKTDVSDFIYTVCKYIDKYSPIIAMEDFNLFIKNDKGLISIKEYKYFQEKLINKLQYYISKELDNEPLQLCHRTTTEKFVQNGIIFRTNRHLTGGFLADSKYLFDKITQIIKEQQND